MQMEQLNSVGWAKTYLIYDMKSNECALIDPVYDFTSQYMNKISEMNLELKMCIATHTHADHITGCFSIAEQTGCEYVMWHSTASLGVTLYVDQTTSLYLGDHEINFHHVPGHTEDSMLIITNSHIFTGDFLFTGEGGAGRDDLPSGRVKSHWDSLQSLKNLSGELLVCTGHEAPGVEMQTLYWNRENNPVLRMNNYAEYETWQSETTAQLGYVSKIKVALPANLFGEIPDEIPWLN